jgi:hypothetical protein
MGEETHQLADVRKLEKLPEDCGELDGALLGLANPTLTSLASAGLDILKVH